MKRYISCGVFSGFSQPRKPILELFVAKNRISSKRKEKSFFWKREQNDFSQPDFGGNLANQLIKDADAWGGRFIFFKVSSNRSGIQTLITFFEKLTML